MRNRPHQTIKEHDGKIDRISEAAMRTNLVNASLARHEGEAMTTLEPDTQGFTLKGMKQFHSWTHGSLDVLLDHVATLPEPLLDKELDGFGFTTVRSQLVHILGCETSWVRRLQGRSFGSWQLAEGETVLQVKALKHEIVAETFGYLATLADEELGKPVTMHWQDGTPFIRTPANVLHHILTHAYHHKGQVVAMCRLHGYPAPDTDLLR